MAAEGPAGFLVEQQEVQNFEDLPLTKKTVGTAPHGIFPVILPVLRPREPALDTVFLSLGGTWGGAALNHSWLVSNVDSFSCPRPPMSG